MGKSKFYSIAFVSVLAAGLAVTEHLSLTGTDEFNQTNLVIAPVEKSKVDSFSSSLIPIPDSKEQSEGSHTHPSQELRPSQNSDRSFGEVVEFVVRETCDDHGHCLIGPVAQHEYENYTIRDLETIADYDGAAAIILANKLGSVDVGRAKKWALRAFLLTKDPYAFQLVMNYSGVYPGETVDANGRLNTVAAEQAYIWLQMGHLLGVSDAADLGQQEMILDRYGVENRSRLERIVGARVAYLNTKRLELTGRNF